jgi:hypothetical protein
MGGTIKRDKREGQKRDKRGQVGRRKECHAPNKKR